MIWEDDDSVLARAVIAVLCVLGLDARAHSLTVDGCAVARAAGSVAWDAIDGKYSRLHANAAALKRGA